MTLSIAGLVLLSAALHPLWNVVVKREPSPSRAFTGLAATLLSVALLHATVAGIPLWPPADAWPLMALSAAGQVLYGVMLVTVLRRGDLSAYYPLVRASPAAIVAWGWAVEGQSYGWPLLAGIALVLTGGWRVQAARGLRLADPVSLAAALLSMLGVAVYSVADGRLMARVPPEAVLFWVQGMALPGLVLGLRLVDRRLPPVTGGGAWWAPVVAGVLAYVSYWLILYAYASGAEVAAVASVRQASIPFSVLMGAVWLGERDLAGRLGASLLMAAGIVLIVLNRSSL